jgi:hypothetical protein
MDLCEFRYTILRAKIQAILFFSHLNRTAVDNTLSSPSFFDCEPLVRFDFVVEFFSEISWIFEVEKVNADALAPEAGQWHCYSEAGALYQAFLWLIVIRVYAWGFETAPFK